MPDDVSAEKRLFKTALEPGDGCPPVERLEKFPECGQRFLVEAAAGLPHVDQVALLVVHAQYDGAEV